jgi:hypothetical protein
MTVAAHDGDADQDITSHYPPGVRGHAVIVIDAGKDGEDALAVWTLSPFGEPIGAWVLPLADLDESRLLEIMTMVRGRCLVGWTEESAVAALGKIEAVLPPEFVARLRTTCLAIPGLIAEAREHRAHYDEELARYKAATGAKPAPFTWARDLPALGDEEAALSPRPFYAASPAATAALTVAKSLGQAIELWQMTEEARFRRPYLRGLGPQQPLPPGWTARLRSAESGLEG